MGDKAISSLTLHGMEIRFLNKTSNKNLKFSIETGYGHLTIAVEENIVAPVFTKESKGCYLNPKGTIKFSGDIKKKRGRPRKNPV